MKTQHSNFTLTSLLYMKWNVGYTVMTQIDFLCGCWLDTCPIITQSEPFWQSLSRAGISISVHLVQLSDSVCLGSILENKHKKNHIFLLQLPQNNPTNTPKTNLFTCTIYKLGLCDMVLSHTYDLIYFRSYHNTSLQKLFINVRTDQ